MDDTQRHIEIKGARANNLKNIDLSIPLGQFVVVTGVSGSGKSSLAFDTLYAEGQRRYVESLSAYARQFLGRMSKPECDYIKGLPPAIAIEQKVNTRNPRSTVGTATEIYDYVRMLFARIGRTFSPVSGNEVKKHSIDDVTETLMGYPEGTRMAILVDIHMPENRHFAAQLDIYRQEGYSRLERDGRFVEISELLESKPDDGEASNYRLVIDRLAASSDVDERGRLADSLETAFFEGAGECVAMVWSDGRINTHVFSTAFREDGIDFLEPSDAMFNFNSPAGACPVCEGFGKVMGISEDLVVPDKSLSVYADAIQCFRGEKMGEWKAELIRLAPEYDFPIHRPYEQLTAAQLDFLWHGKGAWKGIDGFFAWVDSNNYKIQYRVLKARYRGKTLCPECHGGRLRPEAQYVKVAGKCIADITKMSISDLRSFFSNLNLDQKDAKIATRLMAEINSRLAFMDDVGLGYLTLDRPSNTLSGGESQRINLATSLGSALVGSLYVLDEPSIGLHTRDTQRLIKVLKNLRNIGNTLVVVEHDEEIMRASDHIVDIGPDAGSNGGQIVFNGTTADIFGTDIPEHQSYTVDYLKGRLSIPVPQSRRPWRKCIRVKGASENNLKNIDVDFPLGVMTVVTGVSGSGKSTLVRDILYRALARRLDQTADAPGIHKSLTGDVGSLTAVEFVDQNPIGTSSRSNPATYLKAFDEIRQLFASLQLAKQMGHTPAHFSFNADGGRCDECKGEGSVTIPMQFMADITIPCEACHGKRFKSDILEVKYRGRNIYDFLEMTVAETIDFLSQQPGVIENRIIKRLQPLADVGLGYIKLGQSSSTLSGGENQRVKLAFFLAKENRQPTMFIFDEPTTGLHLNDISTLLKSLNHLIDRGHTVVIIEHNLDVVKCADHVIDIGPEGGDEGGNVVATGTPEAIAACPGSHTGRFLAEKLNPNQK